ncbi:MAG: hypothetical protein NT126_10025 [Bacteroidetes bacterium]|nr:hypothetical protein [Bacteroidota bacterium]
MKLLKSLLIFILTIVLFHACKKDSVIPAEPSFNYFPVEKGTFVTYDVDSVLHADNDNKTDDSVYYWHFQLKEVIDSSFLDGQGRVAQVIRRFKRDNDTLSWNFVNIWTQVLTNFAAYKTEDNIPFHKLSFPINNHISWNGNDANTGDEEMYGYEDFHVFYTLNHLNFDSALIVLQRDDDNFVEKVYGKEIYANHVGMIFKERDDLKKVNGMVVEGTEFKMRVIAYGQE